MIRKIGVPTDNLPSDPMQKVAARHGRDARTHTETGLPNEELPVRRQAFLEAVQGLRDAYAADPTRQEAAEVVQRDLSDFATLSGGDTSDMSLSLMDARGDSAQRRDRLKWGAWGSALVGGVTTFGMLNSRPELAIAAGVLGVVGAAACHFAAKAEQRHGEELTRLQGRLNRYELAFDEAQRTYEGSHRAQLAAENYVEGLTGGRPSLVEIVLEDDGVMVGDHLLPIKD